MNKKTFTHFHGAIALLVTSLIFAAPTTLRAFVVTWTGGNGDWKTAADWTNSTLPAPGDSVIIPAGVTVTHTNGNDSVGSISSDGSLRLTGGTLTVTGTVQVNNSFILGGGTLAQAIVQAGTNGQSLIVSNSGTLDNVTINGTLDSGNLITGTDLTLTNSLTLNGSMLLGSATNNNYSLVSCAGNTIINGSGTINFGTSPYDALRLLNGGTILSIGPSITIRGQTGSIGYSGTWGGPQNISVNNLGTISCDVTNGTFNVTGQPVINQGTIRGINGSAVNLSILQNGVNGAVSVAGGSILNLTGAWTNAGTMTETNSTINLGGTFDQFSLGNFSPDGGTVNLTGIYTNTGRTLDLNATTGSWILAGGTILGGNLTNSGGANLLISSGTLNGVTELATLDVGNSINGGSAVITNGLTLNGTMLIGNVTNNFWGRLDFAGSQTLGGAGTVIFQGSSGYNSLREANSGGALTIAPSIFIHGQVGQIGYSGTWGGPQNILVTNLGVIACDVTNGTFYLTGEPFVNSNIVEGINGGTLVFNGLQNFGTVTVTGGGQLYLNSTWDNSHGVINVTNTIVNFQSPFAYPNLGTFNRSGGTFNIDSTFTNTASVLDLNASTGSWTLTGGTILGGSLTNSGGANLLISSGTFDGVTVNGTLDVGNSINGGALNITNGLTVNGPVLIGNPTNTWWGRLDFEGNETIAGTGTVTFGNDASYNALREVNSGGTLTIAPTITIHGQGGQLGYAGTWGGPQNISLINEGVISCDVTNGIFYISGQPVNNQNIMQGINGGSLNINVLLNNGTVTMDTGGTLTLGGSWNNAGTIDVTNTAVILAGNFTATNIGNFNRTAGTITLTGVYYNVGQTLDLNASTGSWILNNGTIYGGTLTNGTSNNLIISSGTFDNVDVEGTLDVGYSISGATLMVTNGLTLNGTALVGNPTNTWWGIINFNGNQTLNGTGTVIFGNTAYNTLRVAYGGTTLTIPPTITIHGQAGQIGYSGIWGGPQNVSVMNNGLISCDVTNGTIYLGGQPFYNASIIQAINGGNLNFNALQNTANGTVFIDSNGTVTLNGAWNNSGALDATNATVNLSGTFALANLGTFNRNGGTVNLTGTLTNTPTTLNLNASTGSWNLAGGYLLGGALTNSGGAQLVIQSGTFDGVDVQGTLDIGVANSGTSLTVTNGMNVDGTALIGNPTNGNYGIIELYGTQTLGGNGTITFGNSPATYNCLRLFYPRTALTIGPALTVHGQNGYIGYATPFGGSTPVGIINTGKISCDVSNGLITVGGQTMTNQGILDANKGTIAIMGTNTLTGGHLTAALNASNSSGKFAFISPANFDGTLQAYLTNGYVPAQGATFTLLSYPSQTGGFAGLTLPSQNQWQTTTTTSNFMITAGAASTGLSVDITSPADGGALTAPATITLTTYVSGGASNPPVTYYQGSTLLGQVASSPYTYVLSNYPAGSYVFSAVVTNTNGAPVYSSPVYVTVNSTGSSIMNFDSLDTSGTNIATGTNLQVYFAQFSALIFSNSPGTTVAVVNQTGIAGGSAVRASSPPNVLTQLGSNGPVSFTVFFETPLTQFSFTRPQLLANPFVSHPAWEAMAQDALGQPLESVSEAQISSSTNVPAQIYTLSGGSISRVTFNSKGSGLTTFNAMLLDNFVLTPGEASNLPPSIEIVSPAANEVFTTTIVPIGVVTYPGLGSVTSVAYYLNGSLLSNTVSPFVIIWTPPSNGVYSLTAIATNDSGLSTMSAPVSFSVASGGFAITLPPVSQTVGVGLQANLSVAVAGGAAAYQWQFNGTNIVGATNALLSIKNTAVTNSGVYAVIVTRGNQSITSPPATLNVVGPPTLGTPTLSTNGGNIVLTVSASDSLPFYYKWLLNGNSLPNATGSFPPGATNISLNISNAPYNSGNYQVVVANAVSSQNSPVVAVSIGLGTPVSTNDGYDSRLVITALTNGQGYVGLNSSDSTAPASGPTTIAGKPAGGFLWYDWTAGFTGVVSLTTRGSTFDTLLGIYTGTSLNNLTTVAEDDDSGGYFTSLVSFNVSQGTMYHFAVAGYKGATGTSVLALSPGSVLGFIGLSNGYFVGGPQPVITQQPTNQIVQAGDTVTLSVTASNAETYQWFFSDAPIANGGTGSTLVITNFPTSAVGNYYVQVSNSVSIVQSAAATIQIATTSQSNAPSNLSVDKFGDTEDLTASRSTSRLHPLDGGGETGGFTLSQAFNTLGATKEEGEPNHAGQPGGASYWYTYTAQSDGTVDFNTTGSTFNTILAIYVGPGNSFATLTNVGAAFTTNFTANGQPDVTISNVTAGTRFFIAVDGYLGTSGAAKMNISASAPTETVNTNVVPITNNTPVVAFTSPANNYLSTQPSVVVKGTVKAAGNKAPIGAYLQLTVNGDALSPVAPTGVNWTATVPLSVGANTIVAQAMTSVDSNTAFASLPVSRTIFYDPAALGPKVKAPITLLTTPPGAGKISGTANHASLQLAKIYTVTAVPAAGFVFDYWSMGPDTNSLAPVTSGPALAFDMTSNLVLQATFIRNPFTNLAGSYNGLFAPSNGVTLASSGFFTATLPATGKGTYSAKMMLDGATVPVSGSFDLTGQSQKIVSRSGKTSVAVNLHLDLSSNSDVLTGTVSEISTNGWSSDLTADRAVFNAKSKPATNYSGKYTAIVPPGDLAPINEPGGYGYATMNTSTAGQVAISGSLADKTTFSQSVPVSKDGNVPLYASLYSHKGLLIGWLALSNDAIAGLQLTWIKPAVAKTLYPTGFTNGDVTVLGSLYVPPAGHANNFVLTNGTLTLSNGNLATALSFTNLAVSGNKLVEQPDGTAVGTITAGTGVMTVTFKPAGARAATTAKGVVLQGTSGTNAAGWFSGTNQSGFFLLQP